MSQLHICNTFFERELETSLKKPLAEWMRSHPAVLQLQFLPILYADPDDLIFVSDLPSHPDPRLQTLDTPVSIQEITHWGPSLAIKTWAENKKIPYSIPDWQIVRKINSKVFSYLESPKLPGSRLLENAADVENWIAQTKGPKVLKTAFGTAGNGHFHLDLPRGSLQTFLKRQFNQNLPLIGEPWVERLFDFSTQWEDNRLLGATVFENESNGTYKGTLVGPTEKIFGSFGWALEEHLSCVRPLIQKIKQMGFFGNFGIDAYVYLNNGKRLQPVVEINGRKTMSWAALQIQKIRAPEKMLRLCYTRADSGLLPSELVVNGKLINCSRNLQIEIL
ncbi:MAG: hypothetical protein V4487_04360 [Chlamydiota bacterium]